MGVLKGGVGWLWLKRSGRGAKVPALRYMPVY
jgi:hypothetical protein